MINFYKNTNFLSLLLAIVLMFLATLTVYGFKDISNLGLYSDDWERYHLYVFSEGASFGRKASLLLDKFPFVLYRAPNLLIIPFSSVLGDWIRNPILGTHIISFVINFGTFLVLFMIIRQISQNYLFSVLSSIFVLTLPGRSATYFWPSTQVEMLSIFLMFLSILIHFKVKIPILVSSLLIVFISLISVLSYEITAFVPLIFLVFLIVKPSKRNLFHFLSTGIGVTVTLFYKFYAYSKIFHLMEIKEVEVQNFQPTSIVKGLLHVTGRLLTQIDVNAVFLAWHNSFGTKLSLYIILSIVIISVILANKHVKIRFDDQTNSLLLLGLSIIFGSIIVYTLSMKSGGEFSIYGKNSRFTSLPIVGSGMVIIYIFSMLKNETGNISKFILPALIFLCVLNINSLKKERMSYINTWNTQKSILGRLDTSALNSKDRVFVFVLDAEKTGEYAVPLFEDYWTLTYSLSVVSKVPRLESDFSSNPYGILGKEDGYKSKNWEKYGYTKNQLYMVNLKDSHPMVVPLFAQK